MVAAYRDSATAGAGQTAIVPSLAVPIPATVQAGDVAVVGIDVHVDTGDFTTPAGWTRLSGPDRIATPNTYSGYLFAKTIAGEAGTSVTFSYSETRRMTAVVGVFSGVTLAGVVTGINVQTTANLVTALPTVSAPAGAALVALWELRASFAEALNVPVPSPWTSGPQAASNFGTLPNVVSRLGYQIAGAAGTYGGESTTTSRSMTGANYVVALPATGTAPTTLDKVRLGAGTVGLRLGASAVDKAYLGTTQVWP